MIYTLSDAARKIGCHKTTVIREAAEQGMGTRLGPVKYITEDDLALLKVILPRARGNPNYCKPDRPPRGQNVRESVSS